MIMNACTLYAFFRLPVNYPRYDPHTCSGAFPFPDSVSQRCPFEKAASARLSAYVY
jgi:hypothetical protein